MLSIVPQDWAVEWLRPVPPDYKMVGPVLAEPGKPLPAELEVEPRLHCTVYGVLARPYIAASTTAMDREPTFWHACRRSWSPLERLASCSCQQGQWPSYVSICMLL